MKKILTALLIMALLACLAGCEKTDVVLDEERAFEVTGEIFSLDIRINAADFKIESGEKFLLESNLRYLSVTERDGVLSIVDEAHNKSNYKDATLTLYVPEEMVFDKVNIETGAAKLTAGRLDTLSLEMKLGAGDVHFDSLYALVGADIEGGAGKFTVKDGTINDLDLEMGIGEVNITAALFGECELKLGIGESNLTLLGHRDDYKIDIEKGLGTVTVNGEKITDFGSSGDGSNHVEIECGVGAFNLSFSEN